MRLPAFSLSFPSAVADFGVAASSIVPFTRVRLRLNRADGAAAVDTLLTFGSTSDSLVLAFDVPLSAGASAAGEPLQLSLAYINAAGDTVFNGGPVTVVAKEDRGSSNSGRPVDVPIRYTGPGSQAASVRLSPRSLTVSEGAAFQFQAQAFDAKGTELTSAPILFLSKNPDRASLASPRSGTGVAGGGRGRTTIVAGLLNGQTDEVDLIIVPQALELQIVSGGGQSGTVGTALASPVVARVIASDGAGVPDVTVRFNASGSGRAAPSSVSTGADGTARTTWTLSSVVGTQTMTVSAGNLAGSPFTLSATARDSAGASNGNGNGNGGNGNSGNDLSKSVMTVKGGDGQSATVGTMLSSPLTIRLSTAAGVAIPDAKVQWNLGGSDGTLSATTTVTDADGLSTNRWTLPARAGDYAFKVSLASAGGVGVTFTARATAPIAPLPGKLVFLTGPSSVPVRLPMTPSVVVEALDANGTLDKSFNDKVTIALASNTGGVRLGGTATVKAVSGQAVFDRLEVDAPASGLTLTASASGFASAGSTTFAVTNPPSKISKNSGDGQQAKPGALLPAKLIVAVDDALGKRMPGVVITWKVTAGDGSVSAESSITDAQGLASVAWTLGRVTGTQSMAAILDGVNGSPITFSATAKP